MKKNAFTMAEIVVAIVVMAIIVAVVVPITKDKYEKVDYASYYLAYKTMQNLNTEIVIPLVKKIKDAESENHKNCILTLNNQYCYKQPFVIPEDGGYTKEKCLEIANQYGMPTSTTCPNSTTTNGYYYAALADRCGGYMNIISTSALVYLADYLYNINNTNYTGYTYATLDEDKVEKLGLIPNSEGKILIPTWGTSTTNGGRYFLPNATYTIGLGVSGRGGPMHNSVCMGEYQKTDYNLCNDIKNSYSVSQSDCNASIDNVKTAVQSANFANLTPHITLISGSKIFLASNFKEMEEIAQLKDSVDEDDRVGFVVYVDIDGKRSKTRLYDDVFPFYLTKSGKVIPGYDSNIVAGANCEKNLAFDILYDKFSGENRMVKQYEIGSITGSDMNSFKNTACISGYVKSLIYCGVSPDMSITYDGVNCKTDTKADCRIRVRKPLRIFR